jgi:hypothetical protein
MGSKPKTMSTMSKDNSTLGTAAPQKRKTVRHILKNLTLSQSLQAQAKNRRLHLLPPLSSSPMLQHLETSQRRNLDRTSM